MHRFAQRLHTQLSAPTAFIFQTDFGQAQFFGLHQAHISV
jgi:hypothetical protein